MLGCPLSCDQSFCSIDMKGRVAVISQNSCFANDRRCLYIAYRSLQGSVDPYSSNSKRTTRSMKDLILYYFFSYDQPLPFWLGLGLVVVLFADFA